MAPSHMTMAGVFVALGCRACAETYVEDSPKREFALSIVEGDRALLVAPASESDRTTWVLTLHAIRDALRDNTFS